MERRIAVIISNYNMPEATGELAYNLGYFNGDLIIVDNGCDLDKHYQFSAVELSLNVQTTHGWLMGLAYADALARKRGVPYFAYWILTTSMVLDPNDLDLVESLAFFLNAYPDAVAISPVWTGEMQAWTHKLMKGTDPWNGTIEEVSYLNTACMYRASWLDSIGRFDPRLTYGWGTDFDMSFKAQQQGKKLLLYHGAQIQIREDIGYKMDRMSMSAEERKRNAREQMDQVLSEKWPEIWPEVRDNERLDLRVHHKG